MPSTTTSIRLPDELRARLERTSRVLKRGKNSIITEAIDQYLRRFDREALIREARRQSLLVRDAEDRRDTEFLQNLADPRDWK